MRRLSDRRAGFKGEGAVALAVGDLDAALVELRTKGVEAEVGKRDSTGCYFAVVVDPDGNRVWLHQHYGHESKS
jgi:predicted enzyme related to lactoylglutathione lyase